MDTARDFGGSIPEYYDRIMGPAHFERFADDLVRRVPRRPPAGVLEVACGTGIVTRRLRKHLDREVRMVATDISKAMLDYASTKLHGDIEWRTADAMALPFADAQFSALVCSFGVMFVPDKELAFREARRVLHEGGTFFFSVWDGLENNPHGSAADEVLVELFPDDPSMNFGAMPYRFNNRAQIAGMLAHARFGEVRMEPVRLSCGSPSAREFATGQVRGTPRGNLVAQRGVAVETVIERLAAKLAAFGGNAPFTYTAQALLVEARAV